MKSQLNRGQQRRLLYFENKGGDIDGARARIGWGAFSRTTRTVYYRGRTFHRGSGISGNFYDADTGEEYWISGVKRSGSNVHRYDRINVIVDGDAADEYALLRGGKATRQTPASRG